MALKHLPLDAIDERELHRLIQGRARETRDIEYKRDTYGNADKDHKEILADISSFANTAGGDIVIGMEAQAGVPTKLAPFKGDADAETLRLESIARAGLEPRIFGLATHVVALSAGGHAIVVRIPRSYNAPHRLIRKGSGEMRFFARSSAGKVEPNVDELRALFLRAPQLAERIRDFRFDRAAKIGAGDTPAPLKDRHILVLHIIPFSGFDTRLALPLDAREGLWRAFPPIGVPTQSFRINIDGLVTRSGEENDATHRAYTQLFHSGIVEAVYSSISGEGMLPPVRVERAIAEYVHRYGEALIALGCSPPFTILASLMGMNGVQYSVGIDRGGFHDDYARPFDRDQYHFSEIVMEEVDPDPYVNSRQLRPLLNQIAQAAGHERSRAFDDQGNFKVTLYS
jgi:hypothetical protein